MWLLACRLQLANMQIIVQRVVSASVSVKDKIVGKIDRGLVCLVGIGQDDTVQDAEWCAEKLLKLKLWNHPETDKPWSRSVVDCEYGLLLISQFTLMGYLSKNRPNFSKAMKPEPAKELYGHFVDKIKNSYGKVDEGVFGEYMQVDLKNDGPVTFTLDSTKR